ncbi:hypothetical protein CBW53_02970 [Yersinia frederiksenii]|nr:hypothetical protein CBW53_02970 [Yersinia frederiksenii]
MNHEFLVKNIKIKLIEAGHSNAIAELSANEGLAYYKRMSQASKKGSVFDDCLKRAKEYAGGYEKTK